MMAVTVAVIKQMPVMIALNFWLLRFEFMSSIVLIVQHVAIAELIDFGFPD
jgi:hypothetical protein